MNQQKQIYNTVFRSKAYGYRINQNERIVTRPSGQISGTVERYEEIFKEHGYTIQLSLI